MRPAFLPPTTEPTVRSGFMLPATMVMISIIAVGAIFFVQNSLHSESQIRRHLEAVAALAAQQVEGDDVRYVSSHLEEQGPQLERLVKLLRSVRHQVQYMEYVYIFERTNDVSQLRFIADADALNTLEQLDEDGDGVVGEDEEASYPGDLYDISDVPALQAQAWAGPTTDAKFTTDQWGTFISGYAPIYNNDGAVIALLGIDMAASDFMHLSWRKFIPILVMFVALGLLLGILTGRISQRRIENKRQFTTLMSNVPGMVYRRTNNADRTMEFVSDGCLDLTGVSPEALQDRSDTEYKDLILEEDRLMVSDTITAALLKQKSFTVTYRITTADNQEKWVWEQGRGVYSSKGKLKAIEGLVIDVTEQKQMDETKNNFMTIASHMLRTPLSGIRWSLEALEGGIEDSDVESINLANNALESITNLTEVLNSILRTTSLEAGMPGLHLEPQPVYSMLENVVGTFKNSAEARKQNITVYCSRDLQLATDAIFFHKIMDSLIGNALSYSLDGGEVAIAANPVMGGVTISVHNFGKTILPDEHGQVFKRFFRGKEAVEFQPDGTGLGLYTAQTVVKMLGGTLEFTSSPKEGTTFTFKLPTID